MRPIPASPQRVLDVGLKPIVEIVDRRKKRSQLVQQCQGSLNLHCVGAAPAVDKCLRLYAVSQVYGSKEQPAAKLGIGKLRAFESTLYREKDSEAWEGGEKLSADGNRMSRGSSSSKSKYLRPGIMPTLFGRHLMQNAVFLGLDEVAANLPALEEIVQGVPMDPEIGLAYEKLDATMQAVIRDMVRTGDRRFLGAMLQTLLAYPDHPFGWQTVGYYDKKGREVPRFVPVVEPPNLDPKPTRPKEQALLDIVQAERVLGRQVWVYTTMTGEKDVADRLLRMFRKAHLKTEVLRSTVELKKREEWIAKHGPANDVILSHPKLVETGLDLFDKNGGHNFSTLVFYQTGYNLFTLRQASRRAWRIGQRLPCKVYYFYYEQTMQPVL